MLWEQVIKLMDSSIHKTSGSFIQDNREALRDVIKKHNIKEIVEIPYTPEYKASDFKGCNLVVFGDDVYRPSIDKQNYYQDNIRLNLIRNIYLRGGNDKVIKDQVLDYLLGTPKDDQLNIIFLNISPPKEFLDTPLGLLMYVGLNCRDDILKADCKKLIHLNEFNTPYRNMISDHNRELVITNDYIDENNIQDYKLIKKEVINRTDETTVNYENHFKKIEKTRSDFVKVYRKDKHRYNIKMPDPFREQGNTTYRYEQNFDSIWEIIGFIIKDYEFHNRSPKLPITELTLDNDKGTIQLDNLDENIRKVVIKNAKSIQISKTNSVEELRIYPSLKDTTSTLSIPDDFANYFPMLKVIDMPNPNKYNFDNSIKILDSYTQRLRRIEKCRSDIIMLEKRINELSNI